MNETERGIAAIKRRQYDEAEMLLAESLFYRGDPYGAGYLSMIHFDEKITPRTEESLDFAMLLWAMTQDELASSAHRLGVQLIKSKNPRVQEKGKSLVMSAEKQGYANSYCIMGILHYQAKEYSAAAASFSKYSKIDKERQPLSLYAKSLEKMSPPEYEKAGDCYAKLYEQYHDPKDRAKAIEMYLKISEVEKALRYLDDDSEEELASLSGSDLAFLGSYYITKESPQPYKARRMYKQAVERGESCKMLLGALCRMLSKLMEDEEAEKEALKYLTEGWVEGEAGWEGRKDLLEMVVERLYQDPLFDLHWPNERLFQLAQELQSEIPVNSLTEPVAMVLAAMYYVTSQMQRDPALELNYLKAARFAAEKAPSRAICSFIIGQAMREEYRAGDSSVNLEEAYSLVQRAASKNFSMALMDLGVGEEKSGNISQALNLYTRAYAGGWSPAAEKIADLYHDGRVGRVMGMPNRRVEAEWREKAKAPSTIRLFT